MTDSDIHCNVIKCRKPLSIETQACVTSCSHIFCLDCANTLFSKSLTCPACNTALSQESSDDIILTQLNPTEEYKSSVLAGLKPDIILDVCSRAIAFYEYQTSQELAFRSILQKNTEEKYNTLKSRFDLVTRDISHVLKVEKEKHKAISSDYQLEKKRSQQIYKKYEEKTKQFQKLKVMYERLKRRSIVPNIQESFSALQPVPPQQTISNNGNHIMSFHNQNTHLQQQQHHQQPATPSMVFDMDNDDVLSRIDRSSTVARSVFMPPNPRQQGGIYTDHSKPQQLHARPYSPSRIPSPVKSTFSVRSSHQKIYKKPSGTNKTKQPQENSEHHQLRHHPNVPPLLLQNHKRMYRMIATHKTIP